MWVLKRRGFRLAFAHGGLEGLALAKVTRPDLVLLNEKMPGMDGLSVLEELRRDPRTANVKVIMASAPPGIGAPTGEAAAQDYLSYPVDFREMNEKVDRVLGLT